MDLPVQHWFFPSTAPSTYQYNPSSFSHAFHMFGAPWTYQYNAGSFSHDFHMFGAPWTSLTTMLVLSLTTFCEPP
jgi:hypothetical protein